MIKQTFVACRCLIWPNFIAQIGWFLLANLADKISPTPSTQEQSVETLLGALFPLERKHRNLLRSLLLFPFVKCRKQSYAYIPSLKARGSALSFSLSPLAKNNLCSLRGYSLLHRLVRRPKRWGSNIYRMFHFPSPSSVFAIGLSPFIRPRVRLSRFPCLVAWIFPICWN